MYRRSLRGSLLLRVRLLRLSQKGLPHRLVRGRAGFAAPDEKSDGDNEQDDDAAGDAGDDADRIGVAATR